MTMSQPCHNHVMTMSQPSHKHVTTKSQPSHNHVRTKSQPYHDHVTTSSVKMVPAPPGICTWGPRGARAARVTWRWHGGKSEFGRGLGPVVARVGVTPLVTTKSQPSHKHFMTKSQPCHNHETTMSQPNHNQVITMS